ncbi:MAG: lysostaphin resistance A-like protein [Phycisphaerae bacterium]|nr:type II CAAX endopeptidase family protein [Tepidisphaeraceae bacterium]
MPYPPYGWPPPPPPPPLGYAMPYGYPPYGYWPIEPPPRPARVWTVFVMFVAVMVTFVVAQIGAVVLLLATNGGFATGLGDAERRVASMLTRPEVYLPLFGLTFLIVGGSAVAGALLSPVRFKERLELGTPGVRWWRVIAMTVGTVACSWVVMSLISLIPLPEGGTLKAFEEMMAGARGWVLVAQIAFIGLIGPLGEELLFRGYIQTRLVTRLGPAWAIAITSLFFGILHMDVVQSTYAAILGVFLGYIAYTSGSIWPAFYGHAANNTASVLFTAFGVESPHELTLAAISAGVLLVCVLVIVLGRNRPAPAVLSPAARSPYDPAFARS